MKERTRKKLLSVISIIFRVISVLAVIAVAFEIVLYFIGFRFVYPAEFSNDWNAISGVAAWVSAGGTIITALAAIQIQKKIADQQNNIQLINTRMQISDAILSVASGIWIILNLSHTDIEKLDRKMLWRLFSFATMEEYRKYSDIICKYNSYFEKHQATVDKFYEAYWNIAWNIWGLELGTTDKEIMKDLSNSLIKADELIKSKEFTELKLYMKEVLSLNK